MEIDRVKFPYTVTVRDSPAIDVNDFGPFQRNSDADGTTFAFPTVEARRRFLARFGGFTVD